MWDSRSYVINAEIVQGFGNLYLFSSIKESIGKLLALSQGTLNNFERVDVAKEVGDGLVGISRI